MSQHNSVIALLRARLSSDRPAIAMAAHNPLTAKLAAEAGFDSSSFCPRITRCGVSSRYAVHADLCRDHSSHASERETDGEGGSPLLAI
jgi:2-methylisocitrate lyase-like PEP mutase family enzyme